MAETIICPHCKGSRVNFIIAPTTGKPTMEEVTCVVCNGTGHVPAPEPEKEEPKPEPKPEPPELWPILVPLGIFSLFFVFLWL